MNNRFTQFDDKIRNLIELAHDSSKESRTLLFHHICDLFLQDRVPNAKSQRRMLREIMYELLSRVDLSVRREVAAQICDMSSPPADLIQVLSEDEIAVAGPLLDRAIIPDEQLIYIIRHGTEAHRIRISRRFGLSPMVRAELARMDAIHDSAQSSGGETSAADILDEKTTADILSIIREQVIREQNAQKDKREQTKSKPHITAVPRPSEPETKPETKPEPDNTVDFKAATAHKPAPAQAANEAGSAAPIHTDIPSADKAAADGLHIKATLPGEAAAFNQEIEGRIEQLQNESARQADFTRSSADWYWEVNRAGTVSFVSDQAFLPFGRPPQALIGEYFADLCQISQTELSEQNPHDSFDELFEKRSSFRDIPFTVTSADGQKSYWLMSGIAVFDTHSGRFRGFRGSASQDQVRLSIDVADVPDAQVAPPRPTPQSPPKHNRRSTDTAPVAAPVAAVKQAIANDAVATQPSHDDGRIAAKEAAEMIQQLSHEFRTPLNAIIGFSEMIDTEAWGPINARYQDQTRNILSAAHNLKNVVNDILDAAKLDTQINELHPESFSLKAVLKDCLATVKAEAIDRRITLADAGNNIDVIIYNDPKATAFCITKMLIASLDGGQPGDTLSLSILVNSDGHIRIEVPLLGTRIAQSERETLFVDPNFAVDSAQNNDLDDIFSKKIGPRFGLSIARKMAKQLGGTIDTRAEQGVITHLVLQLSNLPKNG